MLILLLRGQCAGVAMFPHGHSEILSQMNKHVNPYFPYDIAEILRWR